MPYSLEGLKIIIIPAAQEELLSRFANVERQYKADKSVVTEAYFAMQERIVAELAQHWPERNGGIGRRDVCRRTTVDRVLFSEWAGYLGLPASL